MRKKYVWNLIMVLSILFMILGAYIFVQSVNDFERKEDIEVQKSVDLNDDSTVSPIKSEKPESLKEREEKEERNVHKLKKREDTVEEKDKKNIPCSVDKLPEKRFNPSSRTDVQEVQEPSSTKDKRENQKKIVTSSKVKEKSENKQKDSKDKPQPTKVENNTNTCTISIVCKTILNNKDHLTKGKESYVPKDGVILKETQVELKDGESVFDILKAVCKENKIQLEYSFTPIYNSYYIEGIHQLYEFDCGSQSGWMYQVNGWFPNYGCSAYQVKKGDRILFCYTCKGLGEDVGGGMKERGD